MHFESSPFFRSRNAFLAAGGPPLPPPISFAHFTRWALYGENGYYKKNKKRVGQQAGTDFYTALSLGPLFGELVAASAESLLGPGCFEKYAFVEIGAEPGCSLFEDGASPFADTRTLRIGDVLDIPQKAIVFSNELFDAQPFHRFQYSDGSWKELGVLQDPSSGELSTGFLPSPSPEAAVFLKNLQAQNSSHPEGYCLDISLEAETLLASLLTPPWQGLFLTFDYGRPWEVLFHETPQGTARAYHKHLQVNDLLKNPGEQDLTCDVCWDRLEATLRQHQVPPRRQTQEAFFMHHAATRIQSLLADAQKNARFSPQLHALKALLLPPHMGHAFHALFGLKG